MGGIEIADWLGKVLSTGIEKVITVSGVAAVGRLIGATADVPTALLEGVSQGFRDKTEARSFVTHSIAKAAAEMAVGDPAIMERALTNMLQRQYRIQENKEAVAKATIESLLSSPPASDMGGPSNQFMTTFEQYAESATDSDLRTMFGRLLAGEVRKPGSVSPSTMHFLSMLDRETAILIQKVLPACDENTAFLDNIKPSLHITEIIYLEQAGFWGATPNLSANVKFDEEGLFTSLPRNPVEGYVCGAAPNAVITLSVAALSRAGCDLVMAAEGLFDYEGMSRTLLSKGAHYFYAGKAKYSGEKAFIPKDDILERQDA